MEKKLSAEQLEDAANWFVYKIDEEGEVTRDNEGNPVYNDFFQYVRKITDGKSFPLVSALVGISESKLVHGLMKRMDIHFPFYESRAMVEIAKVAFASNIKKEYGSDGSQYLYEVIGPVYDFFHQMNTQALPDFAEDEFRQIGPLPISLISKEKFQKGTEYYPNDARGRDGVAKDVVEAIDNGTKVLAVGDGPAMTTIKAAKLAVVEGRSDINFTILECNGEQIENGKRAYDNLDAEERTRMEKAGIKIEWVQGDASNMAVFDDETFDAVFSTYVVGAMGGAKLGPKIVEDYAKESARVLKRGGKHITLDFYDGKDMEDGYKNTGDKSQEKLRKTAGIMKPLIGPPLQFCYRNIWDHHTELDDVLIEQSQELGLSWEREHRQIWFGHFPIIRFGGKVLALSIPGYNEIKCQFGLGKIREILPTTHTRCVVA